MYVNVVADKATFQKAFRALKREEDGKELRADVVHNLKALMEPAAGEARSRLLSTPTKGLEHPPPPLYATVARATRPFVRQGGKTAGVGVSVPDAAVRRFPKAPRRLNASKWRRPVYGNRSVWVNQVGSPGWFSGPLEAKRAAYRAAVVEAVSDSIKRVLRRGPR